VANPTAPPISSISQGQARDTVGVAALSSNLQSTTLQERAAGSSQTRAQPGTSATSPARDRGTQGDPLKGQAVMQRSTGERSSPAAKAPAARAGQAKAPATGSGAAAAPAAAVAASDASAPSSGAATPSAAKSGPATSGATATSVAGSSDIRSLIPGVNATRANNTRTISAGPDEVVIVAPVRMLQNLRDKNRDSARANAARPRGGGTSSARAETTEANVAGLDAAEVDPAFAKAYRAFFGGEYTGGEREEHAELVNVGFPPASVSTHPTQKPGVFSLTRL
jgi:hypothetical protein